MNIIEGRDQYRKTEKTKVRLMPMLSSSLIQFLLQYHHLLRVQV